MTYTFTTQATAAETQAAIDAADGMLIITVPWQHSKGYENVAAGDGAVLEVAAPEDHTCWIGTVADAEYEEGYPLTVMIDIS